MKIAAKPYNAEETAITVTGVRLSFCHLAEPRGFMGSDENKKYSCTLLIPKTAEDVVRTLKIAVRNAMVAKWPDKAKRPAGLHNPIRDGDSIRDGSSTGREENAGMWVINAKSSDPVDCFKGRPLEKCEPSEIYSGCYAAVQIGCFSYDMGHKGLAFGLNGVAFMKDGDKFGSDAKKALSDALVDLYDDDVDEVSDDLADALS